LVFTDGSAKGVAAVITDGQVHTRNCPPRSAQWAELRAILLAFEIFSNDSGHETQKQVNAAIPRFHVSATVAVGVCSVAIKTNKEILQDQSGSCARQRALEIIRMASLTGGVSTHGEDGSESPLRISKRGFRSLVVSFKIGQIQLMSPKSF
jgi:hypothetical protein